MSKITPDDYARLHAAYHEDTDLCIIHDQLADEHDAGHLVWLYWPRMIGAVKSAKSFGWFSTTPRRFGHSVGDAMAGVGAWEPRLRMWELLQKSGRIRVQQGAVLVPSERIDVLLVETEKWQSWTSSERKKLERVRSGNAPVHWTMQHLAEFRDVSQNPEGAAPFVTNPVRVPANVTPDLAHVTKNGPLVTTLDKTKQDETEEGRKRPLPASVIRTIESVRSIPGMSQFQLTSNVIKAMEQYPSLTDEAVCEAIAAFEANVPEGATLKSGASWIKLRNCFDVARKRMDEDAAAAVAAAAPVKRRTAAELLAQQEAIWSQPA